MIFFFNKFFASLLMIAIYHQIKTLIGFDVGEKPHKSYLTTREFTNRVNSNLQV